MRVFVLFLCLLFGPVAFAQVLPPVSTYTPEDYQAGTQNWGITQGEEKFIYVANNQGLLEYDGERWSQYPSPNGSVARSVLSVDSRVYVGSYMEFGYYLQDRTRGSAYVSLANNIRGDIRADDQIWKIEAVGGMIVFQSLTQLYIYDPGDGSIRVESMPKGVIKLFTEGDQVIYQDGDERLFSLKGANQSQELTTAGPYFPIVHLWRDQGITYGQTAARGTVALRDGRWVPTDKFPFLKGLRLYCAINLRGGGWAFGTISEGVYVADADGRLSVHIDQVDGLANNTVLSLFEDDLGNLWAGTDNGISAINLRAPIRGYTDVSGGLGTVHAAARYEGRLYLGTNQGLFVHDPGSSSPPALVPGMTAQVWSLFEYDGVLFCGHDRGAYLISDGKAERIGEQLGAWRFTPIPGRPELLLQGGYDGLSVLEKSESGWGLRNKVAGFDYSARFLALDERRTTYVSHEYRGVYGLRMDDDFRSVIEERLYDKPGKSPNASLAAYAGSIYYYSREGLFELDDFDRGFKLLSEPEELTIAANYSSGVMVSDSQRLWFFTADGPAYLYRPALGESLSYRQIDIPRNLLAAKLGYENIRHIGGDSLLLGTTGGYLLLALGEIEEQPHSLQLRAVRTSPSNLPARALPLGEEPTLTHREHNLNFFLAAPSYGKYLGPRYQYRLLGGADEGWSNWSMSPTAGFAELPAGEYVFEARSRIGDARSSNIISYPFSIRRPWYGSRLAIFAYVLLAILAFYVIYQFNRRHYEQKQKELKEESERLIEKQRQRSELELSRLNNERLRQDVESKSREMASTMMSLVKKNELLQEIKTQLESKGGAERNISKVIGTIDLNIDEAETWNLFRDAFENADQEFFKTIKKHHPELTPGDLKLCAYLRLNLSTKEIASMLNISPRSVEVKRYRLRKKMNLERETGLTDYIISV